MDKTLKGNAIVIQGAHINADTAMGWYLGMDSLPANEIAAKFMIGINPEIPKMAKQNDILVGGRNFGFGKVHGSFFTALKAIGISCIVAESFSTQLLQSGLQYPNFLLVEVPGILNSVEMGDDIEVDWETADVRNISKNTEIKGNKFPPYLVEVMKSSGQMGMLARKMAARKQPVN